MIPKAPYKYCYISKSQCSKAIKNTGRCSNKDKENCVQTKRFLKGLHW